LVSEEALQVPNIMYALEESSFCCRFCWKDGRPFTMKVSEGGAPGGRAIVDFKKPCSFPLCCGVGNSVLPCCCFLPKLDTVTPSGIAIKYEPVRNIDESALHVPWLLVALLRELRLLLLHLHAE